MHIDITTKKLKLTASLRKQVDVRLDAALGRFEAGILHVNNPTIGGEAQLPFGGVKATGVGGREMGKTAIEFFTEWKTVYVDYTGAVRTTNVY